MRRNDVKIIGFGGGGDRLVDCIADVDPRHQIYFVNSSLTDIQSLNNYDDVDKNYFCLSDSNGAGRDKNLGRRYAQKNGYNLLDIIQRFDAKTLFFVTSFGGGSGSSAVEVLLGAIKKLKDSGEFDKIVNIIGILPSLDSSDTILRNTLGTWNSIIGNDCVNNMIFVDNNNLSKSDFQSEEEMEKAANEQFAELFDSIFDIPNAYNTKFDTMNLARIINSKGCTYFYNLSDDCNNLDEALKQAEGNSVLAKMYKIKENTVTIENGDQKIEKIRCGFIGTSFSNENYTNSDILDRFEYTEENFEGYNEDNNLLILSGCLPPLLSVQVIQAELQDRDRKKAESSITDFSKFTLDYDTESAVSNIKNEAPISQQKPKSKDKGKSMKKTMKKNLFDMY